MLRTRSRVEVDVGLEELAVHLLPALEVEVAAHREQPFEAVRDDDVDGTAPSRRLGVVIQRYARSRSCGNRMRSDLWMPSRWPARSRRSRLSASGSPVR